MISFLAVLTSSASHLSGNGRDFRICSRKSLFIACDSSVAWLCELHFHCGIQFLGLTSITSSMFNSLVVAMYVTSDDSGLAKPTTSPLARCKVFT